MSTYADPILVTAILVWLGAASLFGVLSPSRIDLGRSQLSDLAAGVSAGVLLSVAYLHLLDDAQERLDELTEYPVANAAAVAGFLVMAIAQALTPCLHGQSNRVPLLPLDDSELDGGQAARARLYALEASISIHSVLIGMSIGLAQSDWAEMLVLAIAMTVHQFFEGFALGILARRTTLTRLAWRVTCVVFTLSLPLGGFVSIAMKLLFSSFASSATYFWVSGLLNAFAAGMLTQIGVEMVNHELTGEHTHVCSAVSPHKQPQGASSASFMLKVAAVIAGAAMFAILAIWA